MPLIRNGVSSTRIGLRISASAPPLRSTARSRSNFARKLRSSSGRAWVAEVRRPRVRSNRVPAAISVSGTAAATIASIRAASPLPTPARWSIRPKLSPWPSVATNCRVGRSGALASGITAALAPIRRPLSPPSASGMIIWLRNSSRTAPSTRIDGAASTASKLGQNSSATADSPTIVAIPRNHRPLPISSARSGTQSRSRKAGKCS